MLRVKIFSGALPNEVEARINRWLEKYKFRVVDKTMRISAYSNIVIAIWYDNQESRGSF